MLVPQPAVIEVQSQYQLYVVGSDKKATVRVVKVGDRVGPNWIITEGLKPGEQVVTDGQLRLVPGAKIQVKGPGQSGRGQGGGQGQGQGVTPADQNQGADQGGQGGGRRRGGGQNQNQ